MASMMARDTQSNTICGVISQIWIRPPRFDMMDTELATALMADLASPVITLKNGFMERFIFRAVELRLSDGRMSTEPVRMFWPDEMIVPGWDITRSTNTSGNSGTMFISDLVLRKTPGYLLFGFVGDFSTQTPLSPFCRLRQFGFDFGTFGRIVNFIFVLHSARRGTEQSALPFVICFTVIAVSFVYFRHTYIIA